MSFYTVQDCIMGFPGYLLLHCLTSARVFPSAAAPFPTPRFSLSFSLTFLHLSPFYSFCLPNTLWPFDPLLTSLTHLLKGDDQHISCELSISDGFILISGHLTCLLSLCAGMVQFVLMRLNGNKKDEVEKLKLNDSFGNSNWKIQRKWVSVPHFWCKIWGRPPQILQNSPETRTRGLVAQVSKEADHPCFPWWWSQCLLVKIFNTWVFHF